MEACEQSIRRLTDKCDRLRDKMKQDKERSERELKQLEDTNHAIQMQVFPKHILRQYSVAWVVTHPSQVKSKCSV